MAEKMYSQRLGIISDTQFQAALNRFSLGRFVSEYLNEDPQLVGEFFTAYRKHKSLRTNFAKRFPIYMLLDRAILWEFFQHQGWRWWPEQWTFRD